MSKSNSNNQDEPIKVMQEDIRDIRNDIERIKSSTHNINRIMTLSNVNTIVDDLKLIIGKSDIKAAILHLTMDKISAQDLATKLGLDRRNLPAYMAPFTDKKAYVTTLKDGKVVYYQRAEIIDLIGFEQREAFASMIESWKKKQTQTVPGIEEQKETPEQNKEDTHTEIQG